VPHAGAVPAGAAGALDAADDVEAAAGAEVLAAEVAAGVLDVLAVLFLLLEHAAAASNTPAISRVAAMREVLTG
jgi:hypothetical protein